MVGLTLRYFYSGRRRPVPEGTSAQDGAEPHNARWPLPLFLGVGTPRAAV